MRWVLAGLAFALLVTLAILTVGVKAENLRLRKRIAEAQLRLHGLRVEAGRRALVEREELADDELIARLRRMAGVPVGGQD